MSVKGNNSSAVVDATAADFTVLQNNTTTRWAVTQLHLMETGSTGDTINFYRSPNASSASGDLVDQVVIPADEPALSIAPTIVLEAGEFLVGNAVTGSLANVWAIYTAYTGSS